MGFLRKFSGLKVLFEACVAIALLSVCLLITQTFMERIASANVLWIKQAYRPTEMPKVQELLDAAVDYGLVRYETDKDQLILLSQAEISAAVADGSLPFKHFGAPRPETSDAMTFSTVRQLLWLPRGPGVTIRREFDTIKRRSAIVGYRTGTNIGALCRSESPAEQSARKDRDKPVCRPAWQIGFDRSDTLSTTSSANSTATRPTYLARFPNADDLVLEELQIDPPELQTFAPIALASRDVFSAWHTVSAPQLRGRTLQLEHADGVLEQSGGADHLSVMVIGRLETHAQGATLPESTQYFCWDAARVASRLESCSNPRKAVAQVLRYNLPFSSNPPRLKISPIEVPLINKSAIKIDSEAPVSLSDRIQLDCERENIPTDRVTCSPRWASSERYVSLANDLTKAFDEDEQRKIAINDAEITDSDDQAALPTPLSESDLVLGGLVNRNANGALVLQDQARKLSLAQALGTSSRQFGKPLAYLASLPPERDIETFRLTVDPVLQQMALDSFNKVLNSENRSANLPSEWDDRRRASFVLLDLTAKEGAGAIRAAVGFPSPPVTASEWDLDALQLVSPSNSPLQAVAWEGGDGRTTPGSVMKILSGITMIQTATGVTRDIPPEKRKLVADAIVGIKNERYTADLQLPRRDPLDLRAPKLTVPRTIEAQASIEDFHKGSPLTAAKALGRTACGTDPNTDTRDYPYGLCEALARSSNIWFAGFALYQDLDKLEQLTSGVSELSHPIAQAQQLQRMGLHKRFALLRGDTGDLNLDDPLVPRAERVLHETHPKLHLGDFSGPSKTFDSERFAASASFGQNLQASPLAVTAITASMATGEIIKPYLIYDSAFEPRSAESLFPDPAAGLFAQRLVLGLKATVQDVGGTAYGKFHGENNRAQGLASRVFGKTGTAQFIDETISKTDFILGTLFTGWITDAEDKTTPRYAFTCAISHLSKNEQICAQLTAELLVRIDAAQQLDDAR